MIKYALAKNQLAKNKPNYVANVSCKSKTNHQGRIRNRKRLF